MSSGLIKIESLRKILRCLLISAGFLPLMGQIRIEERAVLNFLILDFSCSIHLAPARNSDALGRGTEPVSLRTVLTTCRRLDFPLISLNLAMSMRINLMSPLFAEMSSVFVLTCLITSSKSFRVANLSSFLSRRAAKSSIVGSGVEAGRCFEATRFLHGALTLKVFPPFASAEKGSSLDVIFSWLEGG